MGHGRRQVRLEAHLGLKLPTVIQDSLTSWFMILP